MTNKEAIAELKLMAICAKVDGIWYQEEALDMAIEALEQQKTDELILTEKEC